MPEQQKKRWIVWVLLVFAIAGLGGLSLVQLFSVPPSTTSPAAINSPEVTPEAQQQKLVDLEKAYRTVLEREPNNENTFQGLLNTLREMMRLGIKQPQDYVEALEIFVKNNPDKQQYQLMLADAYQRNNQREPASNIYTEILAKEPGNIFALRGTTSLLEPAAATKVLKDTLETAKQAKPGTFDVPGIKLLLGDAYDRQKDYKQALSIYDDLINETPQDWRPLYGKAVVLQKQGNNKDAKDFFDLAANQVPEPQLKQQIKTIAEQLTAPSPSPAASDSPTDQTPAQSPAPTKSPTPSSPASEPAPAE